MCQFAFPVKPDRDYWKNRNRPPRLIFDAHNAVWTIVERMGQNSNLFIKPVAALETKRLKHYEGQIVDHFDHTFAVTKQDRQALLQVKDAASVEADGSITVIPIAVDTLKLSPVKRVEGSRNILTLGTLHYPPNADGIRWFGREVFPLIQKKIPGTSLTIIGKNPPKDLLRLALQNPESIQVTGYVPDLIPYMQQAGVVVIPVRAGGGMRVRILEAFSLSMPVVTTTIGLEGIEAAPGQDVLVEDTAPRFAEAVIRVLNNQSLQDRLGQNGRRCVEKKYDWQVVLQMLDEVYESIA
jgi:glycosyltransferase involved in cell wall biosynthesis